ncbi:MAG: hypothetical protein ACD_69C00009G0001 [uncultured bacterium]|nr:MAG: hypothetical protein ACD_69C00009G0001 [uncultured bacterium]HBY55202.1 cupin domain-containing protein [Coxiellaceae bacterium]
MQKININNKLSLFSNYWSPKIIADLNDSYIKLAKFKGQFVWHKHVNEDELFFVIKGRLLIKLRDQDINLNEGEFVVIPKSVEHLPIAEEEAHILLIEPKTTLNTGDTKSNLTATHLDRI